MRKICRDDEVIVLSGKDRSKIGRVQQVLTNGRAIVSGINMVKRHVKPNPNLDRKGGIETKEASIHLSNLAVYNQGNKKGDRVRIQIDAPNSDGKTKKSRVYVSNAKPLPERALPSAKNAKGSEESAASKTKKDKSTS
jgi:large subunit ribosomal protein L24